MIFSNFKIECFCFCFWFEKKPESFVLDFWRFIKVGNFYFRFDVFFSLFQNLFFVLFLFWKETRELCTWFLKIYLSINGCASSEIGYSIRKNEHLYFAAEMVAMSDVWCGFLPNENKQGWRSKDIRFVVRCRIWRSAWPRPCMHDFFSTVILAILTHYSN